MEYIQGQINKITNSVEYKRSQLAMQTVTK